MGATPIHKDAAYTTAQTGSVLWDPGANSRFVVQTLIIFATGTTDAQTRIFDEADTAGSYLANQFFDVSVNNSISIVIPLVPPFVSAAYGNRLRITTSAGLDLRIVVHGYELPRRA